MAAAGDTLCDPSCPDLSLVLTTSCMPCWVVRVRGTPLPSNAKRCRGRRWRYAKAIQAARTCMIPPWKCQRELDWGAWNSPSNTR